MKNHTKEELENLINEKFTVGKKIIFNNEKKSFVNETEIDLCIAKISDSTYQSVSYFWDGYEVFLKDDEKEIYRGDEEMVKMLAIKSWKNSSEASFMNYPIIFSNLTCEIIDDAN